MGTRIGTGVKAGSLFFYFICITFIDHVQLGALSFLFLISFNFSGSKSANMGPSVVLLGRHVGFYICFI